MTTKHWHMMNGSCGCMPDNNEIHSTKKSAVESAVNLFDDCRGVQTDLIRMDIHYFRDDEQAGADYVEITRCYDKECLTELEM